jgi:hypothetical protein
VVAERRPADDGDVLLNVEVDKVEHTVVVDMVEADIGLVCRLVVDIAHIVHWVEAGLRNKVSTLLVSAAA